MLQATHPKEGCVTPTVKTLFLHVPFHPMDPASFNIQQVFRSTLLASPGETPLPDLTNCHGQRFGYNRLVVAYHRQRNLGNILAPRRLCTPDVQVSAYLGDEAAGRL